MTEAQLNEANKIQHDRTLVYEQMKDMKSQIENCSRKSFKTEDSKDHFDEFKLALLVACDDYVVNERKKMDSKFEIL